MATRQRRPADSFGLPAYTLVGRVLVDGFAGLVLGRRRLIVAERQQTPSPLRVPNLAASAAASPPHEASPPAAQRTPRSTSRLTARQLQVTLLLRDGLRQTEIASCLGISVRQVERLLGAARERVGALTTSELVAMLASGALAHANPRTPIQTSLGARTRPLGDGPFELTRAGQDPCARCDMSNRNATVRWARRRSTCPRK